MNDTLIRAFVKRVKLENMNKLDKLKTELKQWEDIVPVNNMGKWARQTKIDKLKQLIEDNEDLGPEFDGAGFSEDDRIVNGQYMVNKKNKK